MEHLWKIIWSQLKYALETLGIWFIGYQPTSTSPAPWAHNWIKAEHRVGTPNPSCAIDWLSYLLTTAGEQNEEPRGSFQEIINPFLEIW